MFQILLSITVVCLIANTSTDAVSHNNYKHANHGFQPNSGFYRSVDQVAEASSSGGDGHLERLETSGESVNLVGGAEQRTQRFGITAYGGNGVQGNYPTSGASPGLYGPVKIDLGGVLLGSLIGLGAVLILPKLVQAFSYSYGGGYGRSVEADMNSFTALLSKVDETLEKNSVDSSSCVQRIVCSYVQTSLDNMSIGNGTEIDQFISSISANSLVDYMLDGTAIKQAVEAGKNVNTNCQDLYSRCKLDKQTLLKILSSMLPS